MEFVDTPRNATTNAVKCACRIVSVMDQEWIDERYKVQRYDR